MNLKVVTLLSFMLNFKLKTKELKFNSFNTIYSQIKLLLWLNQPKRISQTTFQELSCKSYKNINIDLSTM